MERIYISFDKNFSCKVVTPTKELETKFSNAIQIQNNTLFIFLFFWQKIDFVQFTSTGKEVLV